MPRAVVGVCVSLSPSFALHTQLPPLDILIFALRPLRLAHTTGHLLLPTLVTLHPLTLPPHSLPTDTVRPRKPPNSVPADMSNLVEHDLDPEEMEQEEDAFGTSANRVPWLQRQRRDCCPGRKGRPS